MKFLDTDGLAYFWSKVQAALSKKASKSISVDTTLLAEAWIGNSAPYAYTVSSANITATCPIELVAQPSVDAAKLTVLQEANIQGGAQSSGSICLLAYGDKPTIDVPVTLIVRGDL